MPHIIAVALLGTALYGAYRLVRREMKRVGEQLDQRPADAREAETAARLVKDPKTGIYRPEGQ